MQKMIKVTAVIAVILVALSMLALLISIPLQRVLAGSVFHYPAEAVGVLPQFPVTQFVVCLLTLGCTILLAVCAGKKGIILPEILLLAVLLLVIPFLDGFLSAFLNAALGQFKGEAYVAASSMVNMISNYCMMPANVGNSLALVVCGMNMVHKRMSKKLDKTAA